MSDSSKGEPMKIKSSNQHLHRAWRRQSYLIRERIKYFFQKKNQVYICEVSYYGDQVVQFGVLDMNERYIDEKPMGRDIVMRKLETGRVSYATHIRGKYCVAPYGLFTEYARWVIVYRPKPWKWVSRDEMLYILFAVAKQVIEEYKILVAEWYERGEICLDVYNNHISKTNVANWELDQLREKYCFTSI